MNPWDIDLVGFSSMYLKRAKKEKIDLMTAGRIIYMAWKVLRMQSDHLVVNMETKEEVIEQGFGWEDIPTATWLANDDDYSYTNLLMKMPESPLEEPLRRDSTRKVTLIELLSAFDEVRKESEQYQILDQLRQEERIQLEQKARKAMKGSAHEDHLEEDVATVWERICQFPKKSMNFTELCQVDSAEERIKTFISILFLAYEKKIIVHQQKFPYGEIYIKTIGYT
jgi:segregation and condensation protein A